jgi:2,5-diketo-D-gluconate reductase B
MKTLNLRDTTVPQLGFGTWQLTGADCTRAVRDALDVGYRHVDTARIYGNESEVGQALDESGVDPDELFVTTKVWRDALDPAGVVATVESSLVKLRLDVLDNVLLHWPHDDHPPEASLDALAQCRERGLIRHYGVSNYPPRLFARAIAHDPTVWNDQVEHHLFLEQAALRDLAAKHDAFVTAYSPLARGQVFANDVVEAIAEEHGVPASSVALAWLLRRDRVAVIPKATGRDHIEANWAAQDVVLTEAQVARLDGLQKDRRLIDPAFAPDWEPRAAAL